MAVSTVEPHFVQQADGPVFTGDRGGVLACHGCGRTLIEGYDPDRFLAIAIACGTCGAVTQTPALPDGSAPPVPLSIIDGPVDPSDYAVALASGATLISKAEMDRVAGLYRPRNPPSNLYTFADSRLDDAEATFERLTGGALPAVPVGFAEGAATHALAWSVQHLRERMRGESWACLETPATAVACVTVAGFQHFAATWSEHPLFPAMAATAGDRGFSAHGLALFAAAHCLLMQNNRIGFPTPSGTPGRMPFVRLATGPSQSIPVITKVFDRFEEPWGAAWTADSVRAAVQEAIESEQGRINPRNPGMLLLSPGSAKYGFDDAVLAALQAVVPAIGRRHRGLMAAGMILLRLMVGPDARTVQFGYMFLPVTNKHYRGEGGLA